MAGDAILWTNLLLHYLLCVMQSAQSISVGSAGDLADAPAGVGSCI
jgi:hypothetical protein